jgi:hypothetical protein
VPVRDGLRVGVGAVSAAEVPAVPRPGVVRAQAELAAAGLLAAQGFAAQSIACAFRAAVLAAQCALAALDETRDHPSDVVSAYVRRVVRERAMDPATGRALRTLLNRSALAERTWCDTPAAEATAALAEAEAVLDAVTTWLDDPHRSAPRTGSATRLPARTPKRRRP